VAKDTLDTDMSLKVTKICPNCESPTTVPWFLVVGGPLWPFGVWHCGHCHTPLRFKLFAYYIAVLVGISFVVLISLLVELSGFERGSWPNILAMIFSAGAGLMWLPATIGVVERGRA